MAWSGGTWVKQDKVLPGAHINVKSKTTKRHFVPPTQNNTAVLGKSILGIMRLGTGIGN